MFNSYQETTLQYDKTKCIGCGKCTAVCPHRVFTQNGNKAELADASACMECGACQLNCPAGAITVDSGVGCAGSMIRAALRGEKLDSANCTADKKRKRRVTPSFFLYTILRRVYSLLNYLS